jgi:hypothetical protein
MFKCTQPFEPLHWAGAQEWLPLLPNNGPSNSKVNSAKQIGIKDSYHETATNQRRTSYMLWLPWKWVCSAFLLFLSLIIGTKSGKVIRVI